jgi:hypothetical protein
LLSTQAPAADTQRRIGLYSPRVRHSTVAYLRLRLLELREEGLDRARAAIERRLSIDDLLAAPPAPQPAGAGHAGQAPRPDGKAKCPARRNDEP